jgi:hypothetical protein
MKKSPHALVQILSPGGARGDFMFYPLSTHCLPTVYPQLKNARWRHQKNRPIKQPICSVLVIARPLQACESVVSGGNRFHMIFHKAVCRLFCS